ncbi:MAG: deaminase [Bacteroidetes bacterium]|nr:deaminase [Bacteroidota bacterium]
MSQKWDHRYLELAKLISTWSKDPNKQVGAVITDANYVRGIGFNGLPRGVMDDEKILKDKNAKLPLIIHAELNAIFAARGLGDTIYVWPCLPCTQCMGAIIQQGGIKRVVTSVTTKHTRSSWNKDLVYNMASETGILLYFI